MPSTLPQLLPTMPQSLPMPPQLSRLLLQLTMPQLQLTRLRLMLMRSLPTPSPMLLLMTTQRPTSTLRSSPMVPPMLPDLTPLLFPMDVSNMSNTLPMVMMDMSPMLHTRELLSTPRRNHTSQPQLQLTTLKSSLCFVNIYLNYLLII